MNKSLVKIDLRIADKMDAQTQLPFEYVKNGGTYHNIIYALMWEKMGPGGKWISYSKAKKMAKEYSLLWFVEDSQKLVELTDQNENLIQKNSQVFLVRKELVRAKLAMVNNETLAAQTIDEEMFDEEGSDPHGLIDLGIFDDEPRNERMASPESSSSSEEDEEEELEDE